MTNPLVSIIVPVYNAQKGLSRCLESICSQTYQELEIIVLNDGSMEDSLAICEQFRAKDPRIVVGDCQSTNSSSSGFLYQFFWRVLSVRAGGMGVEINSHRGNSFLIEKEKRTE